MSRGLYALSLAFFFGVGFRSFVQFDIYVVLFFFVLAGASLGYFLLNRDAHAIFIVSLAFVMLAAGALRFSYAEHKLNAARETFSYNNEQVEISGVVVSEPVEKETTQQFIVEVPQTNIVVVAERFPQVQYGDVVILRGVSKLPEKFETETGRVFDYPQYLAKEKVTHQLIFPEFFVVGSGEGSFIKHKLFSFKDLFIKSVRKNVPEPHSSLLGGLVVGAQEALGEDLLDAFRVTGIIHIVVLSGYNVTIVAEAIMRFFKFAPRGLSMWLGALGIIFFAVLTGGTATIVRASIMALLVILARATGRRYEITRALFIAALIMVFHNPYILMFDPSFQLSFLATLGLIYVAPFIEKLFKFIPTKLQFREFATATVSTQLFVLPLLLFQIGSLSTVAVPVNLLVLVVVPLTMFVGFLTGVVGIVNATLAAPLGFISFLFLEYILTVVRWFSEIPFASITAKTFSVSGMVGVYGLYAIALLMLHAHHSRKEMVERN